MRFLIHAVLAAALIVSDVAQAASLPGGDGEDRRRAAATFAEDARYQRSETAWKTIMASVCVGCGAPPPPLEIVRKLPQNTRLERQADIDVPVAPTSLPAPTEPVPPAQAGTVVEQPAAVARKHAARGTARGTARVAARIVRPRQRSAARLRKRIELVRLQRLRERRRLALVRRRQEARRALRLTQARPTDLRGRTIEPAWPNSRITAAQPARRGRPIGALASADPSLSAPHPSSPAQPPARDCPRRRDTLFVERSRTLQCAEDR